MALDGIPSTHGSTTEDRTGPPRTLGYAYRVDEFDDKLPLHTKWLGGLKILLIPMITNTYDYHLWNVHFTCHALLHWCVFFIISLPVIFTIPYTSFYSTHIPDKFIEFNEFNRIFTQENSNEEFQSLWQEIAPVNIVHSSVTNGFCCWTSWFSTYLPMWTSWNFRKTYQYLSTFTSWFSSGQVKYGKPRPNGYVEVNS